MASLWTSKPEDWEDPFKGITIDEATLEAAVKDGIDKIRQEQEKCKHSNVQRWGPSYIPRIDGSHRKYDSSICLDCGKSIDQNY